MNAKLNRTFRVDLMVDDYVVAKMFLQEGAIDCEAILCEFFELWGDFYEFIDDETSVGIHPTSEELIELIDGMSKWHPLRDYINPIEVFFTAKGTKKEILVYALEEEDE